MRVFLVLFLVFSYPLFSATLKIDFIKYKDAFNREYKKYKKIVSNEYFAYKKEVAKKWRKAELPTKTKYVSYSKDLKTRSSIDYKKGEIEIEVIDNNEKMAKNKLKKSLLNLILKDVKTAYKEDIVEQNIQKKIKNLKLVRKSEVKSNMPLVGDLIFNKKPTEKEAKKYVNKILKTHKIKIRASKLKNSKVYKIKIKLPSNYAIRRAKKFKPLVLKYAKKFKLPPALIMAVIHSESSFNPFARSWVPAYGLMQIVPQSAGVDAYEHLTGKRLILSSNYLYSPRNNIQIGTAYLHLIYYKYFKYVRNKMSRTFITIASYNTGAGNVARSFVGTNDLLKASFVINNMTPLEVYNYLLKNLPYNETKVYLKRVTKRMKSYSYALDTNKL